MNIRNIVFATTTLCFHASGWPIIGLAQTQGTFVSGVAVYKDGQSGNVEKAPGVELYLVTGALRGRQGMLPTMIEDQDTTCSRMNGDLLRDEGLFQLYSQSSVSIVSVIYKRRAADQNHPPQPEYFSTVIHPALRRERDRFVRKLELELWPTDRAVTDAVAFTNLVRGIIWSNLAMERLTKGKEGKKDEVLAELTDLVELLPEDKELRRAMIEYMLKRLPAMFPPDVEGTIVELLPGADHPFWTTKGERGAQNREKWTRFRMQLLQPQFQIPRRAQPKG